MAAAVSAAVVAMQSAAAVFNNRKDGGSVLATRRRRQCQRRWLQCKALLRCSTRLQQRVCISNSSGSSLAAAHGGVGGSKNRRVRGSLVTQTWHREDGGSVSATRRRRQCQRWWLQCKASLRCSTRHQQRVCSRDSSGSSLAEARGGVGGSKNPEDGGSLVTQTWHSLLF